MILVHDAGAFTGKRSFPESRIVTKLNRPVQSTLARRSCIVVKKARRLIIYGNDLMSLTIYHNPNCTTSRNVLRLLRDAGLEPQVVEYLKTPPSRARMQELLAAMGMKPRDILRRSGTPYDELGLDDPALTDDQILDALGAHPILMQRPVVVSDKGVRLCRPLERVHEIVEI